MKTIKYAGTVVYYDGVQVFWGLDSIGGHYIALLVEVGNEQDRYLVAGVSPDELSRFRGGKLDLRSLLLSSPLDEWYIADTQGDFTQPFALVPQKGRLSEFDLLPESGFLVEGKPANDIVR